MKGMRKKCGKADCPAPKGLCIEHASPDHPKCEYWVGGEKEQFEEIQKKGISNSHKLPWTGESFQPTDIEIISQRAVPLIIGMIGSPDAGKTSYLGMLYTLLFNGKKFENWQFAGSYTLAAWETLAQYLKIRSNGNIEFAPPTPSNPDFYSLYHLAIKKGKSFRDLLFADSSGEVFNLWAEDVQDSNAENARWIYENSHGFIFMVDSVALIERRGAARAEIVQIAEQLATNLNARPVAIVWTKADRISEIRKNIKDALEEDLIQVFKDSQVFEVSNFSKSDPDILCHENNLAVTHYLLEHFDTSKTKQLKPEVIVSNDLLFNYRRAYESK